MRERFSRGQLVMLSGKPKLHGLMWEMAHPQVEIWPAMKTSRRRPNAARLSADRRAAQWHFAASSAARSSAAALLGRGLSADFPGGARPCGRFAQALPRDPFSRRVTRVLARARRRFIYQELFILQLALAVKRHQQHAPATAPPLEATAQDRRPHPPAVSLRADRRAAAGDRRDRRRHGPPRADEPPAARRRGQRQDDRGRVRHAAGRGARLPGGARWPPPKSWPGSTAPRSNGCCAGSQVRRGLLTGGLAARTARASCSSRSPPARCDIVVGTQAVIQDDVSFAKLGLVVIDEQHKFGVRQRATLKQAGQRSALPGDDRHAHPAHGRHDAVRRSGCFDAPRQRRRAGRQVHTYLAASRSSAAAGGNSSAASCAKGGRATSSRRWWRSRTQFDGRQPGRKLRRRWPTASWRRFAWDWSTAG